MPPLSDLAKAQSLWSLTNPYPVSETASSQVFRATAPDGTAVALKILKPRGADEIIGAGLLGWYGGDGAVGLRGIADNLILMDWAEGPTLGDQVRANGDCDTALGVSSLLNRLHRPRTTPAPSGLDPLDRRFRPLLTGAIQDIPTLARPAVARATILASHLLATTPDPIPLHGDIHHDNIILADTGWLAIDPKGVWGDRAYDMANLFLNPVGATALVLTPDRIESLAADLAARTGHPVTRILGWAAAHSALSACWSIGDGQSADIALAACPLLCVALDRAGGLPV